MVHWFLVYWFLDLLVYCLGLLPWFIGLLIYWFIGLLPWFIGLLDVRNIRSARSDVQIGSDYADEEIKPVADVQIPQRPVGVQGSRAW